jgi:hypothetical protein
MEKLELNVTHKLQMYGTHDNLVDWVYCDMTAEDWNSWTNKPGHC